MGLNRITTKRTISMNILAKLPRQFTIEVFQTGASWGSDGMTYGAKVFTSGRVKRMLGESSRAVSESAAIYQALKSVSNKMKYRQLYPQIVKIVKEYEAEIKARAER